MKKEYRFKIGKEEKNDWMDRKFEEWFRKQTGNTPIMYYIKNGASSPSTCADKLKIKYLKALIEMMRKKK